MPQKFDIHDRGAPEGVECVPWYRPPPGVTEGPWRTRRSIIGGLLIHNDEGRRWFKEYYNIELADDHSQDRNVPHRLRNLLIEKDVDAYGCATAPRRLESAVSDTLIITHIERGPFTHNGPEAYEEVYDQDRIPLSGVKEEKVKDELRDKFGITTCGYKSYYTNLY